MANKKPVKSAPYIAMPGKLIVAVNMNQKNDMEIELIPGLTIYMNKFFGDDRKITNPSLAIVREVGPGITDIKKNDIILCHHNTFRSVVANGYFLGHMGKEDKLDLFSINYERVQIKLNPDGTPVPLKEMMLVKRIENRVNSIIAQSEAHVKNHHNIFEIEYIGDNCDGLKVGDKVITYTKSDYEIDYCFNQKNLSAIRVKYTDVLAILEDTEQPV